MAAQIATRVQQRRAVITRLVITAVCMATANGTATTTSIIQCVSSRPITAHSVSTTNSFRLRRHFSGSAFELNQINSAQTTCSKDKTDGTQYAEQSQRGQY